MSYGLYIHIPFCKNKCPYCSFASYTGKDSIADPYCRAVNKEILSRLTALFSQSPETVYIGGGTPSLLPVENIGQILFDLPLDEVEEFTIEANPESLTELWLDQMLAHGANRISIGVQSLDDEILKRLGRIHSSAEAEKAIDLARTAGFDNLSLDLMFGVPGQTMEIWTDTLEKALALNPEHISCYSLGIEEDTQYFELMQSSGLDIPEPSITTEMYLCMQEKLSSYGYNRYEISNFSIPGMESKHNSAYWDFTPYMGAGSSSHSFDGSVRSWNVSDPEGYIERIGNSDSATDGYEKLNSEKRLIETIMLSLRTKNGLREETLKDFPASSINNLQQKVAELINEGFLQRNKSGNIVLDEKGIMLADEVITELLSAI